ncbi:hypothetical protein [Massilia pseudoviolaceinigra]|uniref:hypothetical protein n=1 Tax=Massilia pseudoviolaceinigra TaxID=3057165 RepID=UPI002796A6D6|nr:hypothetical protein [Massilia sp. CCM 9206]MDQ1921048.1 hypothetical protein [Massilia sp. CCM 9206]
MMKTLRPQPAVLADWLNELARRLGRPAEDLAAAGLMASDFCGDVEVRTPYGMTVRFSLAFFLVRPSFSQAVVFTEHSGYVEFDLEDDMVFAEISESTYRHASDSASQ